MYDVTENLVSPVFSPGAPAPSETAPAWIEVAPGAPYFVTDQGEAWTPIGYNDSIAWVELEGLFRRRDLAAVEAHLQKLKAQGVTCIRLMLECAQSRHRFIERPVGAFSPRMVQLWDDLFALCEAAGLRILLTPFDTFWTWIRWKGHPYNRANGGMLDKPSRLLLDPDARAAIKARLGFAVERWGGSGALFAWDLWNEIHPAQAEDSADVFADFIADLSQHVRALEQKLYGRTHPQTVSLFGPELHWRPGMNIAEPIFRHPDLDFATLHIYDSAAIDAPKNTVDPARAMGRIVRDCLAETGSDRPFLDTEHGPIHTFKDKHKNLPEAFDDEMFRHMAWAHLASGGAGGGMRWPNRHPHVLTPGMRAAQRAMSAFLPLIDWASFRRRNVGEAVMTVPGPKALAVFACADVRQAVVYLLRRDTLGGDGRLRADAAAITPTIRLSGLPAGPFTVTPFETSTGVALAPLQATADARGALTFSTPAFVADLVLAIVKTASGHA